MTSYRPSIIYVWDHINSNKPQVCLVPVNLVNNGKMECSQQVWESKFLKVLLFTSLCTIFSGTSFSTGSVEFLFWGFVLPGAFSNQTLFLLSIPESSSHKSEICYSENTHFIQQPAYLYALLTLLKEKQMHSNISMVGLRGRETVITRERVFENIPNSISYWKKAKYEMLSKIDTFGPFQVFYTLSCADKRWLSNFAAIMLEKGYSIPYSAEEAENTYN